MSDQQEFSCRACGGQGYYDEVQPKCCGNFTPHGVCRIVCAEQEIIRYPCELCGGSGKALTDLLPCPFCGNADIDAHEIPPHTHTIAKFMPDHKGSVAVECHPCGVGVLRDTMDKAVAAWNRRAP